MRVLPLLLLTACAPPEAPETLDELGAYLFAHVDDRRDAALVAGLEKLDLWLDDHMEDTSEGYAVTTPSEDVLGALENAFRDPERLVGAAVGADLRYTTLDVAPLLTTVDPEDVFPGSYDFYEREHLTDPRCFARHTCAWAEQANHSRNNYPLIDIEQHNRAQLRWVELDAGPAIVHRTWLTEPAVITPKLLEVPDQLYLNVVLPHGDGHRRLQATWLDARLLGDAPVPPGLALSLVISSMRTGATAVEDWYDGETER